jgi:hypothetical protein
MGEENFLVLRRCGMRCLKPDENVSLPRAKVCDLQVGAPGIPGMPPFLNLIAEKEMTSLIQMAKDEKSLS